MSHVPTRALQNSTLEEKCQHGAGKQRHYYITSTTSAWRSIVVALLACAMLGLSRAYSSGAAAAFGE